VKGCAASWSFPSYPAKSGRLGRLGRLAGCLFGSRTADLLGSARRLVPASCRGLERILRRKLAEFQQAGITGLGYVSSHGDWPLSPLSCLELSNTPSGCS